MTIVNQILLRLLLVLFLSHNCLNHSCYGFSFYEDHARGWHWYELIPLEDQPKKKTEDNKTERAANSQPKTPTELIKAYRQEVEARLHKAWVYPTPQNVQSYQEIQKDLMRRSKIFSTVWMQNVFQNPELDHTLISPVNQQARHLQIDLEKERVCKTIQRLSESFGLFFFFSSHCPYCQKFAPIVKRFAENYGWKVVAISVDADASGTDLSGRGTVAEFPNAEADNGLSTRWGLKALPALFAINPHTKEAIPIAYGLTSLDEMENRIMMVLGGRS